MISWSSTRVLWTCLLSWTNMFVDEQRIGKSCVHVRVRISHLCSCSCLCSNFLSLAPLSNLVSLSNPWKNFFSIFLNLGLLCKHQTPRTCSLTNNNLEKVVFMFVFKFPICVLVLFCVRISYPWLLLQIYCFFQIYGRIFFHFLNLGLLCKQQTLRACSSTNNDLEKVVFMFLFEFPNCVLVLVCVRISYPWPLFQI